jgi:Lrp/AsnC family leucine-responsive transcriptional regulator
VVIESAPGGVASAASQLKDARAEPDSVCAAPGGEFFAMSSPPSTLDKIDLRILRVLQADGRISNLKLAEEVHLSPTAVLERVKRLTREGYILGYEARLNPAKLGAGLLVFVEILLDRTVHDVMDTFKAAVQVRPEILEAHLVAGGFDYLLKTRVADMAAYRQFIGSVIWTLPGVRETRTYAVMEEVKNTALLPV